MNEFISVVRTIKAKSLLYETISALLRVDGQLKEAALVTGPLRTTSADLQSGCISDNDLH
jgi:hypothetical protein